MSGYRVAALRLPGRVVCLGQTGSTNDDAADLARKGAAHLTCILAEEQTAGRGRRGRRWQTFPYDSIAASFVVKRGGGPTLALAAAVAVAEALHKATGLNARVKWPNDILVNGRKVAGILAEAPGGDFHILGIGLNVNVPEDGLPLDFTGTALEVEGGRRYEREAILNAIGESLRGTLDGVATGGWAVVAPRYRRLCDTLGKPVTWQSEAQTLSGIATDLTAEGALVLKLDNGALHEIRAGDILAQATTAQPS